jgi:two-component system chemotaxis response regulator CheB
VNGSLAVIFDDSTHEHWILEIEPTAEALARALKQVNARLSESPSRWVKLVGPAERLKTLRFIVADKSKVKSVFDTKGEPYKLLFYPETGRLRVSTEPSAKELPSVTVSAPVSTASAPIRVLIVDDSATIRKLLVKILDEEHGFRVVGQAANVDEAEEILSREKVDLITLDIHMPGMDGVTYLEKMSSREHPPVVMISSVNYNDAVKALKCLELGAVDYIEKPEGMKLAQEAAHIRAILKVASTKRTDRSKRVSASQITYIPVGGPDKPLVVLGASTGGVEALRVVLTEFPENSPPVLIVQHMPPFFSEAFAVRLNDLCKIKVKEARDNDRVEDGTAYIAPGGKQMKIVEEQGGLRILVRDDPPVNRHAPSVDYLFRSVAELGKRWKVVAGLLTGMGRDGAEGLLLLKNRHWYTIAESEETCVVYGMPREAVQLQAAEAVLPLQQIASALFRALTKKSKEKS